MKVSDRAQLVMIASFVESLTGSIAPGPHYMFLVSLIDGCAVVTCLAASCQ